MTATQDLAGPTQVHDLVVSFYREVVFDDLLEPIFGEVAEVDWAEHIPRLVAYWCRILFRTPDHGGTVMVAHRRLHDLAPIGPDHCDRWFQLWVRSVDERWSGPNSERAKYHAEVIMTALAYWVFGFSWTAGGIGAGSAPDADPWE
jgi:hemoglobin